MITVQDAATGITYVREATPEEQAIIDQLAEDHDTELAGQPTYEELLSQLEALTQQINAVAARQEAQS